MVIATNGYTGDVTATLKPRLRPVASHIIATKELPEDLVKSLIPKGRVVSDTKRVLCYYRRSPDDKRVIFGGRARFTQVTPEVSAPVLHGYMLERWPQLKGTKVTHAWTGNVAFAFDFLPHMGQEQGMHYLMACNGSGVAMMSYLGYQTARKIAGGSNAPINAFDGQDFPTVPFYSGNPVVPADGRRPYRTRDWWDLFDGLTVRPYHQVLCARFSRSKPSARSVLRSSTSSSPIWTRSRCLPLGHGTAVRYWSGWAGISRLS